MAALTATLVSVVNAIEGYFVNPAPYHVGLMVGQVIGFNLIPFAIGGIVFLSKRRLLAFFSDGCTHSWSVLLVRYIKRALMLSGHLRLSVGAQ